MATFTGNSSGNFIAALTGTIIGFTGGTVAQLQDASGDTFHGLAGTDSIFAGDGNDNLFGNIGADWLDGGLGADFLYDDDPGSYWNDTLNGAAGADYIRSLGGSDVLNGGTSGSDIDTLYFDRSWQTTNLTFLASATSGSATISGDGSSAVNFEKYQIFGGSGNDTLTGAGYDDVLYGGNGADSLTGNGGNDALFDADPSGGISGTERDTLNGGAGDDVFHSTGGVDRIVGGAGLDLLSFNRSGSATALNFDLSSYNSASGTVTIGGDGTVIDGIETFYVSTGSAADQIRLHDGDDRAYGGNGNDTIHGGWGDDDLSGEVGNDRLTGGAGIDILRGGAGSDTADYSANANWLDNHAPDFIVHLSETGSGRTDYYMFYPSEFEGVEDYLYDMENVVTASSTDLIYLQNSVGRVIDAGDNVASNRGIMNVGDLVTYSSGGAGYESTRGVKVLLGTGAAPAADQDRLINIETLHTTIFNDVITVTDSRSYRIWTYQGDDQVYGNAGNDDIIGESGNDTLNGGGGNDTLIGGVGIDSVNGGAGNDVIYYDAADNPAQVLGGADTDTLVFTAGAAPTTFNLVSHQFERAEGHSATPATTRGLPMLTTMILLGARHTRPA